MVRARFMSSRGAFRTIAEQDFATLDDVVRDCVRRYHLSGFTGFKIVDSEEPDSWRITATTPGGRGGRNLAFVDAIGEE